ncbi:MAG: hypothetical protein FWE37_04465 [Spirochaetaceae bacterium]|nr:hypothetical protein [Spirochaetaceae bacterium]
MTLKRLGLSLLVLTLLALAACNRSGGSGSNNGNGNGTVTVPPVHWDLPSEEAIIAAVEQLGGHNVIIDTYNINGSDISQVSTAMGDTEIEVIVFFDFAGPVTQVNLEAQRAIVQLFTDFNNVAVTAIGNVVGVNLVPVQHLLPTRQEILNIISSLINGDNNIDVNNLIYTADDSLVNDGDAALSTAEIRITVTYYVNGPTTDVNMEVKSAVVGLFTNFYNVAVTAVGHDISVRKMDTFLARNAGPRVGVRYNTMSSSALGWLRGHPSGNGRWITSDIANEFMRYGVTINSYQRIYILMFLDSTTIREYEFATSNMGNYGAILPVTARDFNWSGSNFVFIEGSEVSGIPPGDALRQIEELYLEVVFPTRN